MADKWDGNEFDAVLLNVAMKRKRFPELCSRFLSKTLKSEINNLKSATVELNNAGYNNNTWCIPDKHKEEIRKSLQHINSLDTLNKAEDVLQKTRRIKCVLDQIQKEKTCEMDIHLSNINIQMHKAGVK